MNEEEFYQFSNAIKLFKMKYGRIPEKYCDYIILQAIKPNSSLNKNFEQNRILLKRAFEEKSSYIVEAKELPQAEIRFGKLDDGIEGQATSIFCTTRLITYESEKIFYPIDVINIMYHEIQHACQNRDICSDKINDKYQYKMIKEKILEDTDSKYYKKNYEYVYSEIDARVQALIQAQEYLQYLGLTKAEIEEIKFNLYNGHGFQKAMEHEDKVLKQADNKVFENKLEKLNEVFEKEIAKNPKYLEIFPILKKEFKLDGTRKTEEEMKDEMAEELVNNPQNRSQILFEYSTIMDKSLDELTPKANVEQSIFASIDFSVSAMQRTEVTNFIKREINKKEPSILEDNKSKDFVPEELE